MSQLRTTSTRVPIVLKVFVTFLHGLMFSIALTVVGVVSIATLFDPESEVARYGRPPSAGEVAAGRVWFDAPIEATVPIDGAQADPWNGCVLQRERYSRLGKRSDWELQRAYAYAAASIHSEGRAFAIPLHSVGIAAPGRVLSSQEARRRMGSDLPDEDVAALEWRSDQIGAVRYVEKCVKAGQWLFFDGTIESSSYRSRVAQVSAGPTLRSRRLSFLDVRMAATSGLLAPLAYVIALVFVWGAPFSLVNLLRRRAHLAERSEVPWATLTLASLVALVGSVSAGSALGVPAAGTVSAIVGSAFLCLACVVRARRRALLAIPPGELHEAIVEAGDAAVTTPMLHAPAAAWLLEMFRIGAKGAQTRVAVLDSRTPLRVRFASEPRGPGQVEIRDAAIDLPALDVLRSGVELDAMKLPMQPLHIDKQYRVRESALPVGSTVMVIGKREKQLSPRAEDAVGDAGYRGPGFESVVRSAELDRVVIIEGDRASLAARIAQDAAKLRAVAIIAAVGVVSSVATLATALILATRM